MLTNEDSDRSMKLNKKTILITGGTSGIGLELANNFSGAATQSSSPAEIGNGSKTPSGRYRVSTLSRTT